MSARTVTVWTGDFGPVRVPEPEWCISDHSATAIFRSDIQHDSAAVELEVRTERHGLMSAMPVFFSQRPYSPTDARILVAVELEEYHGLTGDEVNLVADALERHASALRVFAQELPRLWEAES